MDKLSELENQSIYIIREAAYHFDNVAMLWSIGKDSTTLLWLCRKAFFGQIPFPVLHIDTSYKFKEIYDFRDTYAAKWKLNLLVARNEEALAAGMSHESKFECCNELKTNALKQAIARYGFDGLLLGIRRDEHGIRAKERYFSPRNEEFQWDYQDQPPELWDQYKSQTDQETHIRIHPLLHWTEQDIWQYVKREGMPFVSLYCAKDHKRYRSIGCECCCDPVQSDAVTIDEIVQELAITETGEREGRAQDKEDANTMQKLRALGYM